MKRVNDIRLKIQCGEHYHHSKLLTIASFMRSAPEIPQARAARNYPAEREWKIYFARRVGEIMCGRPGMYVFKAGSGSPIGRCAVCGGKLQFEVQDEVGEVILEASGDGSQPRFIWEDEPEVIGADKAETETTAEEQAAIAPPESEERDGI